MIDDILTGAVLGLVAGMLPGPYTALVAGQALRRGFRSASRLALVPLATDVPPMLVASFTLAWADSTVLRWIGIAGGVLFVLLGVRLFRRGAGGGRGGRPDAGADGEGGGGDGPDGFPSSRAARTFAGVAAAGLLSPTPWLFWFAVGGPLLLSQQRREGWIAAVLTAVCFLAFVMAAAAVVAWGASRGRSLSRRWRRRLVRGAAGFMVVAGGVLAWQSAAGNFESLLEGQRTLRELLP